MAHNPPTPIRRKLGRPSERSGAWRDEHRDDETEKRRSRNRLSQRHFRERRNQHVKELEERVRVLQMDEGQRNARLIAENKDLRESLNIVKSKVARLTALLQDLSNNLNQATEASDSKPVDDCHKEWHSALGSITYESSSEKNLGERHDEPLANLDATVDTSNEVEESGDQIMNWGILDPPSTDQNLADAMAEEQTCIFDLEQPTSDIGMSNSAPTLATSTYFNPSAQNHCYINFSIGQDMIDSTEFFEYSLLVGFEAGDAPLLQTLYMLLSRQFSDPLSLDTSISERVDKMVFTIRDYLKMAGGAITETLTSRACLTAMICFVKHVSPLPPVMWFSSYCYKLVERVLCWRLCQGLVPSTLLPPNYEPSELQLATSHSILIDWIAFSPLRDRLIQHFNRSPMLDQIFIEIMEHAVIEVADISTILANVQSGPGFLGVWNLYHAIASSNVDIRMDAICGQHSLELRDTSFYGLLQVYKLPLPDTSKICQKQCSEQGNWEPVPLVQLLSSAPLAQKLYHHLNLHAAHESWRIDPAFFEKYPQLKWDTYETAVARGTSYRVALDWILASQAPLLNVVWPATAL